MVTRQPRRSIHPAISGVIAAKAADAAATRAASDAREALRAASVAAVKAGAPIRQVAEAAEVSRDTIYAWIAPSPSPTKPEEGSRDA